MITRRTYPLGKTQLSVLEAGPAEGPVLVLLHGIPANACLWRKVMPLLAEQGYRVLAPDLPGYGETQTPLQDYDYSLKGIADVLYQWMVSADLNNVWLVAHDIGGGVAQIFACDYEQRLAALTLSNCIVSDLWPIFTISLLKKMASVGLYPCMASLGAMTNPYSLHELKRSFFDRTVLTNDIKRTVFFADKVYNPEGKQRFARHLQALDPQQLQAYAARLSQLQIPVLLAWASNDINQPWNPIGKHLQSLLDNPDTGFLEQAGHFFPLERAEEYTRLLIPWAQKKMFHSA